MKNLILTLALVSGAAQATKADSQILHARCSLWAEAARLGDGVMELHFEKALDLSDEHIMYHRGTANGLAMGMSDDHGNTFEQTARALYKHICVDLLAEEQK